MVIYLLAAFALPICLADIKEFKIPNIYLKALALFAAFFVFVSGVGKISNLLIILFCLIPLGLLGIGMGDLKLLALVAISLNSTIYSIDQRYLYFIALIAAAHLLFVTTLRRSVPSKIPLAPSIFLGLPFI